MEMNRGNIKEIIKEALDERIAEFYIDREEHYKDHEFIKSWRCFNDKVVSTAVVATTKIFIISLFGLIVTGFIYWITGKGR